jgi:hypothetical protein
MYKKAESWKGESSNSTLATEYANRVVQPDHPMRLPRHPSAEGFLAMEVGWIFRYFVSQYYNR